MSQQPPPRRRGLGWPWQAYERRGDAGYNVIFKGDLPNMTLGLLLFALVFIALMWLLGAVDRGGEEESPSPEALAVCDAWAQLRDDLEGEGMPRDEQVARVREVHALAERTELRARPLDVIANRMEEGIAVDPRQVENVERQCAQLTEDQPASVGR